MADPMEGTDVSQATAPTAEATRAYSRAYYARNREKIRAQRKPQYDPEYHREYYRRNRERMLARVKAHSATPDAAAKRRAWKEANKAKVRQYQRAYYVANRLKAIDAMNRRRINATASNAIPFTSEQLMQRLSMYAGCWMCGAEWEHIDHVKPLSRGGPHILANLRPSCGRCNNRKGSTWPFSVTSTWRTELCH